MKPHVMNHTDEEFPTEDPFTDWSEITAAVGKDFFHKLNRALGVILGADCVYIAEIPFNAEACLQTLAAYRDGAKVSNYTFTSPGTACAQALREGAAVCVGDLQETFPKAAHLAPEIRSFFAMKLHGLNHQPIGVIALGWRDESPDLDKARSLVEKMTGRISAELQRIRSATLLKKQLHLTQEILNAIPIPVFYKNTELEYMGCNREFEKVIGCCQKDLQGKRVKDVAPNDCFGRFQDVDRRVLLTGQLESYEGDMIYNDGDKRDVVFKKAVFHDDDGHIGGVVGTMFDITDIKNAEKEIYRLANFDPATGLPNRQYFLNALEKSTFRALRDKKRLAVLCLDLDRFKSISNALTHNGRDQLLKEYSSRIAYQSRERDIYAQIGNDRFAVVLNSVASEQTSEAVARRMLGTLAEPVVVSGHEIFCTGSIGIAHLETDGVDPQTLLLNAETAMLRARKQGGNMYLHSSQDFNRAAQERLTLEAGLRRALHDRALALYYQPQVDMRSGALYGAETLLRWTHPTLGQVPPDQFIPIAEECGLIGPIGDWALKMACQQNAAWQAAGYPPIRVAVNLSGHQLTRSLPSRISEILRETGLAAEFLELELTESVMIENSEVNRAILQELKGIGVHLSIDDFGTGYSSLRYLQRFPFDTLKIDHSFTKDLEVEEGCAALTDTVIAIALRHNLKIIAEGIETLGQRDHLIASGCPSGQGYLFGRPVSSIEFEQNFQSPHYCKTG